MKKILICVITILFILLSSVSLAGAQVSNTAALRSANLTLVKITSSYKSVICQRMDYFWSVRSGNYGSFLYNLKQRYCQSSSSPIPAPLPTDKPSPSPAPAPEPSPVPPPKPIPNPTPAPAPSPIPDLSNLIGNPSFEIADDSGQPSSWFQGNWGSNQANFIYPVQGFSDSKAAQIEMTQYTDGDAKWYFQDVPIVSTKHYEFSDYYKSTASSKLTIRFLMDDNTEQYLDIANLSASLLWQNVTKTFSAPYNVKSLTIFHLISSVGSLTVDNYSLKEVPFSGGFSQGFVSLNFDDGWLATYQNALPILNSAGLASTQYIITGSFNDPEYVNQSQVLAMQASGHEIGAHTKTHPHLVSLSQSQMQDEIAGSRNDLLSLGVSSVNSFDYPFGEYDSIVVSVVKNAGFSNARIVEPGFNTKDTDPYLLKSQSVEVSTSFEEVKSWIDSAVRDKTWVILVFHQIDHSGLQYSSTPEMLSQIVDYIKSQNVPVKTNSQGVELMGY